MEIGDSEKKLMLQKVSTACLASFSFTQKILLQ